MQPREIPAVLDMVSDLSKHTGTVLGMAMENILSRPTSAISRNSDDFMPNKENGFVEHLLQNAYNSVYHDELYYCDWALRVWRSWFWPASSLLRSSL